jgi:hypothetical protein
MLLEPLTKATVPGVVAIAEIVTGLPYLAVVTEPGRARVRVGVALMTESEIVADVVAGVPAESITVIVCE